MAQSAKSLAIPHDPCDKEITAKAVEAAGFKNVGGTREISLHIKVKSTKHIYSVLYMYMQVKCGNTEKTRTELLVFETRFYRRNLDFRFQKKITNVEV